MPASVKATASIVVNKQVPEFVRDDNQKFIDFLKAYYEWLENFYPQQHLEDIRDIDNTVNMFVEYFSREVLQSIPREVISDKRFLAKHIKDLYLSKGTEDSYKFLFRILYNEDAEVYFPKVDMLRVSDGKWSERQLIRVISTTGDARNLLGQLITQTRIFPNGDIERATARVENVILFRYLTQDIAELTLSKDSIIGTFKQTNDIQTFTITGNSFVDNTPIVCTVLPIIQEFSIINNQGGSYSNVGDIVYFSSPTGVLARSEVGAVSPGSLSELIVAAGGTGYQKGDIISFNNTGTGGPELSPSLSASGFVSEVDRDSFLLEDGTGKLLSEELGDIDIESSNSGAIKKATLLSGGAFYSKLPICSLPTGAGRANGKILAASNSIGRITNIVTSESGFDYINPPYFFVPLSVVIKNPSGNFLTGETITSLPQSIRLERNTDDNLILENGDKFLNEKQQVAQAILEKIDNDTHLIKLKEGTSFNGFLKEDESGYVLDEDADIFVREDSGQFQHNMRIRGLTSNTTATICSISNPNIRVRVNAVTSQVGGFSSSDGQISESSKRIQDSLYYQDFSYVVKVGQSINLYRDVVKKLLHPIGLALFGEVKIKNVIKTETKLQTRILNYQIRQLIDMKMKAVGNYRTAGEMYSTLSKNQIVLGITDFIVSTLNISVLASEFLPTLNFPNLTPQEIHLLDLRAEVIGFEQAKELEINLAKLLTKANKVDRNPVTLLEKSTPAFDGSARRYGINLVDLERYKFTHKPSVSGTKFANSDGTPAYTTGTYGVVNTYPNPNFNYWTYGNTQIKDFTNLTVGEILNNPYRKVNFAIESEIGIIRLPASALRFSTDDARFTFDDTFTMDADSVEMDASIYKWDNNNLLFDLYT